MNDDKLQSQINSFLPEKDKPPVTPPQPPVMPTPQTTPGVPDPDHPLDKLVQQVSPEEKARVFSQKPIRTYESDVAEAIARKNASVITMMVAENQKKTGQEVVSNKAPSNAGKKVLLILLSLVFIGAGLVGAYYFYLQSPLVPDEPAKPAVKIPSLIPADTQKVIMANSLKDEQLFRFLQANFDQNEVTDDAVLELIPAKNMGSSTVRITGSEFISAASLDVPDVLGRSLTDQWMLGISASQGQKNPFIIFHTDFFQNAFAGMLKWEESMPEELASLLNFRERARTNDISTTSIAEYFNIRGTFEDKIVRNRDVREFISERGEMLFLYTFLDKNTILITTSENTIGSLLDRIDKQTYIR